MSLTAIARRCDGVVARVRLSLVPWIQEVERILDPEGRSLYHKSLWNPGPATVIVILHSPTSISAILHNMSSSPKTASQRMIQLELWLLRVEEENSVISSV
jgi:hypothetical protein